MKNELIVNDHPKCSLSEAFKTIKTNLQFSSVETRIKSIMITSSIPSEGKSFVVANLASAFANSNVKVLMVDTDLRKGRQHHIFDVDNEKGLSDLLIDEDIKKNHLKYIKPTKIKNLSLLPMGTTAPNPTELLCSNKCRELMNILKNEYTLLILDAAPVNGVTDPLVVTQYVDKTIIVAALNSTPMEVLNDTKKALEKVTDNVAGVIVNKVEQSNRPYYNKYYDNYYTE